MSKRKTKIVKDQMKFFDMNAHKHEHGHESTNQAALFDEYVNKEQFKSLSWLAKEKVLLDYGCGTGSTLERFLKGRNPKKYQVYGVDIAKEAINEISKKYPIYKFFTIKDNKIPQIKDGSVDGVYMMHILHHAKNHKDIFGTIYKKLKKEGKYVINDLSSTNPILGFFRGLFTIMPNFIKNRFGDDLVVDGMIPEKYKIHTDDIIKELQAMGFKIEVVDYGHLFFFVFGWTDRFIPLSRLGFMKTLYKTLIGLETFLLKFHFFQKYAEVISIECIKK